MTSGTRNPLIDDYLRRLRRAGRDLPPERLRELLAEIEGHLSETVHPNMSDSELLTVLERLGSPDDIVDAERSPAYERNTRPGWREWSAVILLPLGGFALGIGWVVGVVLLWSSRLWSTRDKLIGTLIVPGGIATALPLLVLTGTKRRCTTLAPNNAFATVGDHPLVHCTPSGGPAPITLTLQIVVLVVFVVGPIISAIYLARRARRRSAFLGS